MKRFPILITLLAIFNLLQAEEEYPVFPRGVPACMELPDWTPAVNLKGDTISCRYTIPINWNQIYQEIQNKESQRIQVLLENKIWKAQFPGGKQYSSEMEFRDAIWTSTFLYNGQTETLETSYKICDDTIKTYDRKQYKILQLSDSTLVIQYLPERITIGVGAVKYINIINSPAKMRENENRLDTIWRKEDIWAKGLSFIEQGIDTTGIEVPRWACWKNLEDYFTARMKYPAHLLEKNQAGYSVVMFSLDTLGLPRGINILTTQHKDFDKEVIRLVKELPHCLPCRNKDGKRMECLYTVYVPFLPQHYRDRVKADSIWEEELKHSFVTWESPPRFQDGNPSAVTDYIDKRLTYNPKLLGNQKKTRGIYTIRIDSYGEVTEVKTLRSCGIPAWDVQVMEISKGMPHWTPAVDYHGKGEYRSSVWTVSVVFKKKNREKALIAYTNKEDLEAGAPVCYLNEHGDTIVPYGKYKFCQADTIRNIGFVYENKPDVKIICIDVEGRKLFNVFEYDNGVDYVREGLFRITDNNGLIGFADTLGNMVVTPQFKFAFPFENGKAKVTFSGESKEVPDSNGEKHYWDSSDWHYINKNGKILNK